MLAAAAPVIIEEVICGIAKWEILLLWLVAMLLYTLCHEIKFYGYKLETIMEFSLDEMLWTCQSFFS